MITEDWYFRSHRLQLALAARDAGFDVSVVTRVDSDEEDMRSENIRLISLNMRRGQIKPFAELRTLIDLWRILNRERAEIVHNVALKPVIFGTIAARLVGGRGIVNALAGLGYVFTSQGPKAEILRVIVKCAFRLLFQSRVVHVIVQNPDDASLVKSLGVPSDRVSLISGSGIDVSLFRPEPEPRGRIVVAMVSRMLWDKGTGDLVEAARILGNEGREIIVRLVGPTDSGNPSSIPFSVLECWVQDGIVEWIGPTSDVGSVWARAHIGVLPSYREGLPKSLLEAAACGRPLVTTDVPGCREVVIHEKTGLLVPPKNPAALAAAISRLADDPALRKRLGMAARERVKDHFSLDKVIEQTIALYRSILGST